MKGEKKLTAIIVFIGSVLLFFGVVYLLATDIDFFLNKQIVSGKLRIIKEANNKIELTISYYDKYKNDNVQKIKKIANSYRNTLQELGSNNVTIIYTKWFNQTYIDGIKKPRILILFFEVAMILFFYFGIKWGWQKLF